jgi:hypothetical protein
MATAANLLSRRERTVSHHHGASSREQCAARAGKPSPTRPAVRRAKQISQSGLKNDRRADPGWAEGKRGDPKAANRCVWAMRLHDQYVGFVQTVRVAHGIVKIERLQVDPHWQHTSVLQGLLDQIHQYCQEHGCDRLIAPRGSMPGWLVSQLPRYGFRPVPQNNDAETIYEVQPEFSIAGERTNTGHNRVIGVV